MDKQAILEEKNLFAEMLTNTNEKIFLEAIDQFFEQDSSFNYIESNDLDTSDIEIEKMNDKFCDSLDEDDCCAAFNNTIKDISTELDSEDASSHGNIFPTKKKLFLHDFLIINQENIYKTQNSPGAASDGELYFITALLFASNRWGDNTGINYKAEAQRILNCVQIGRAHV